MLSRLRSFLDQRIISIQSYPVSHIIIIAMTIVWMIAIESDYNTTIMDTLIKLLLAGGLMLPLSVIKPKHRITQAAVVAVGLAYYLLLPSSIEDMVYAQGVWIVGSIILAWIIPSVITARDHQDSQELTWSQFTHWWTSLAQGVIGGLILWGGIAASLASIEFLFSVDLGSDIYQHIGVISVLCIGGWIGLINLQQNSLSLLETRGNPVRGKGAVRRTEGLEVSYPRWMRIFGQYIFLPLCVIYGLILISYGIKIIATGVWPQGQLVYMVSGYVGFGLLTWFALLPLEDNNRWLSKAYRALFISFVVTSGLMIGALIMRVQQYGWTIDRVFVLAVITWIIVIGGGSVIRTKKKWIIGLSSLIIVGALTIYMSPSIVKSYQLDKVRSVINTASTNTGDATQLYRSLDYLADNYGTGWTEQVFSSEQVAQLSGASQYDLAAQAMKTLGITDYETTNYYDQGADTYWSFYNDNQGSIDISGYRTMIQFDRYQSASDDVSISGTKINISDITIDLNTYIDGLSNLNGQVNPEPYIVTEDTIKLIIIQANGQKTNTGLIIDGFRGYALVK